MQARPTARERAGAALLPVAGPRFRLAVAGGFVLVAGWIAREATATPSLEWMFLFRLADVRSGAEAWDFFRELRTGIPPLLAAVEIALQGATGSAQIVEGPFYRIGLLAAYALPFAVFARTRLEVVLGAAASLVFVDYLVVRAQPYADWNYSVYFPLFVLLALAFAERARATRGAGGPSPWLCAAAGLFLSAAELTRPFMLVILPLVLLGLHRMLRPYSKAALFAFLIPLGLLSGGWHAKLLWLHDGQLLISNNGGFNVHAGWSRVVEEWPEFTEREGWQAERPKEQPVRGSGRFAFLNWNSAAHAEKSRALSAAALGWMAAHPLETGAHLGRRLRSFLAVRARPNAPWLYRPLVLVGLAWLFANAAWLLFLLARDRDLDWLGRVESLLVVVAVLHLFFLAVIVSREEARLITHALPFLAALPRLFFVEGPRPATPG